MTEPAGSDSRGRLLAIDLGAKRVGVAVCDELRISVRPLEAIERRSWKALLLQIREITATSEIGGLVIGLPLSLDGSDGPAAREARSVAAKFRLSLSIPVYLQDERLTTFAAKSHLKDTERTDREIAREIDSEAAAIILRDFIQTQSTSQPTR